MSDLNELNVGPRWYIVYTRTGYENKVKLSIERVVENRNLSDVIFDVKIPVVTSTTTDAKGREKIVEEKVYPNYVFVKMVMNDSTWHAIRPISGVAGFVGPGARPVPLTDEEVREANLEGNANSEGVSTVDSYQVGDEVEIVDGFFKGQVVKLIEISEDGNTVTVMVSTANREMAVVFDINNIKKI